MSIFLLSFFAILSILSVYLVRKYGRLFYYSFQFNGPPAYPIIGNALWFINKTPLELMATFHYIINTYGSCVRMWMGPQLMLGITDPKLAEQILSSQKLIDKGQDYELLREWLGDGLLLSSGKKWMARRKAITPAFHFKILEQFVEVFDKQGHTLIGKLKKYANKQEPFDVFPLITLYALDVICETAMGINTDAQMNSDNEYVRAVKTMTNILYIRMMDAFMGSPFFHFTSNKRKQTKAIKILHDFTDNVIVSRRKELLSKKSNEKSMSFDNNENLIGIKKKMALLDVLLQTEIDGKPLTNTEIREEVDTFMFEGHDTTTAAISFALYSIAKYPVIQKKILEEIDEVLGPMNRSPTIKDLNSMPYLELVIKETLRLYPSVPMIGRTAKEDFILGGKLVPPGTNLIISQFQMQRNPKYVKNPLEFIPERYLEEVTADKENPYKYIPFSAGPRNCIGQKFAMYEMKSVLLKILQNYELSIHPDSKEPDVVAEIILRPENGIFVQIKERNP